MFGSNSPSLADIAAVTDNNRNNGGLNDGNGWWIIIILLALFGRYGNGSDRDGDRKGSTTVVTVPSNGYGGMMGMGYGFESASLQRGFDNQTVISKLDGLNSGVCSLGYDQLAQMNTINNNITQTGFAMQQAINNNTVDGMRNTNALSTQFSSCCCDLKAALKDILYDMATNACAIKTEVTRQVMLLSRTRTLVSRCLTTRFVTASVLLKCVRWRERIGIFVIVSMLVIATMLFRVLHPTLLIRFGILGPDLTAIAPAVVAANLLILKSIGKDKNERV